MKTESLLWIIVIELAVLLFGLWDAAQKASAEATSLSSTAGSIGTLLSNL